METVAVQNLAKSRPEPGKDSLRMSIQPKFGWGRWIRADVAHHYLGVSRNWFAKHVRPFVPVISISTQARAYRKSDLDARAEQIENHLIQTIDGNTDQREYTACNGRPIIEKGDKTIWDERERDPVNFSLRV